MKNYLIKAAIGLVIILAFMACEKKNNWIFPSSNITSEFRDITGYTELEVNDAIEVEVNFTETPQPVEIIANENLHQYIQVEKSSDKLLIRLQDNVSINGKAQLKVVLTTGFLTGYIANGASLIQLADTLQASHVAINLTGASRMSGYSLSCLDLDADLADAAEAELTVNGKINIKASGASILRYKGDGTIDSQDLKDASKVIKID